MTPTASASLSRNNLISFIPRIAWNTCTIRARPFWTGGNPGNRRASRHLILSWQQDYPRLRSITCQAPHVVKPLNFSSSQTPAGRIDELDGLRGLLALWVALSHIFSWCGFANVPDTVSIPHRVKLLWTQFAYAPGAVDTFIILSGFVISYLLHSRPQSYRQFMIGRFFRIYPVYLICLLMGLAMIYWEPFVLRQAPWHRTEYFDWVRPVADSQLGNIWVHLLAT